MMAWQRDLAARIGKKILELKEVETISIRNWIWSVSGVLARAPKKKISYLIEEKLRILLFSCCIQIERWTTARKYHRAGFFPGGRGGKPGEDKEMCKFSHILQEI